ncbi:PIG-L family deacetylase [Paenibacillus larvae]|nr:PIG-L family deacetylase [Paenibacillus larvae]MDT2257851.1 PIG-L family deacetylase [Paenibacillus larvae]MDT2265163.1 PIG-L family deacetylase [Paenibacillus larvae]MDT2288146.1 PIG-L family deacetylase [Paenibacillus larvae]MDT2291978.1 PIG-L family deacetylase [Paenibacillus larvae]
MNKKLLFVFAHPDDESFGCGGTIPKYHHAGASISLVSATSGCKGKPGPFQLTTREEKAKHREGELQRACGILGVDKLILYRYLDGEVNQVGKKELTDRIAATILEEAPDVIVTFPPDGISGHPDHIAISFAVQRAVQQAEQDMSPDLYPDLYFIALPLKSLFEDKG